MNVAIIIQSLSKGGAEKQCVYLASALSEKYNVYLIVLRGKLVEQSFLKSLENNKVSVIRLNEGMFNNIVRTYKIFREKRIDLIFSYLASGNFINSLVGLMARVPIKIGGIRNVQLSKKKLPLERFFHNKVLTKSISNSHSAVYELTKKGFNRNKFHVIHNAFDLKQSVLLRNKKRKINILSVARFVSQKDYLTAIKTLARLKQLINDRYDFCYTIVGYGILENEIRSNIINFGLEDNVLIYINPKNIDEYYKNADIFLNTSLFEGVSNSIMEAMSFSLPIIATNVGDTDKLIKDGINGFLTDIKDDEGIAKKLYTLCNSLNLRNEFGVKSYNNLRDNFSFNSFQNKYLNFISKISK